jgi:hypothetical protein
MTAGKIDLKTELRDIRIKPLLSTHTRSSIIGEPEVGEDFFGRAWGELRQTIDEIFTAKPRQASIELQYRVSRL